MLKRIIRYICNDPAGLLTKILCCCFLGAMFLFFLITTLIIGGEEGTFGLFGGQLGVELNQAPWVDIDTISAWEVYDLENFSMLLLYIDATLVWQYGFYVALGIALVWLLVRLTSRRPNAPINTLRFIRWVGLIQLCLPILYGLMIVLFSENFTVGTWVHTPLFEAEPGNSLLCALIPLGYLLICTALQYLIIALPPLIFSKFKK